MKDNEKITENKEKSPVKKKILGCIAMLAFFLVCVAVGAAFGAVLSGIEGFDDLKIGGYLIILLGFVAVHYVSIIAHEAGHLVFGLISGYKFSSFRILSFMWVKDGDRIRFCRFSLAGTGGQCLMEPPAPDKYGRIPVFLYNMGGVFVNVILGAFCVAAYFAASGFSAILAVISAFGALYNLLAGAALNGIPIKTAAINNDGHNAVSLGRDLTAQRAFRLQMLMNAEQTRGRRLRDMPEEWFALPTDEEMKNSMTASTAVFACNRLMDEERFAEADELMERILGMDSGIVGIHRNLLVCDRIFCELIGECREDAVTELLDSKQCAFMKTMKKFPTVIRTEYGVALLHEGNEEKAAQIREMFEKVGKSYPYKQDISSERELLDKLDEKYRAKRAQTDEVC